MHVISPCFPAALLVALCLGAVLWTCPGLTQEGRHPVLDHGVNPERAAQYEKAVARVMAMSAEEMLSFVPEKHFSRFCECPKCQGGTQGDNVFTWSIEEPEKLTCRYCGFVRLPDGECPEDRVLEGKNLLGETRTYRYYESPEHGTRHFFSRYIDYHKRIWIIGQGRALGQAWLATGKPEYARRVALILDKIANVYPHLAVVKVGGMPNRYFKIPEKQTPPYTWDAGKWGWHSPGGELPSGVIQFYDMVYDSPELDRLSAERGYDVRERIERDFFHPVFEAVRATRNHVDNYVAYLSTAVNMGRVLRQPSWVHWAVHWIGENVNAGCFYDGMWHESPSYHYMTIGGLRRCFASVRGYSDPEGYTDGADGKRFDDFDPDREFPFWARVQHAPEVLDFPTGCSTVVHDTWSNQRRSEPREATGSTILPGFGHASLGRGRGADQLQAQLHFSGGYGHHHRDNLNLCLWAKGREMLSDVGYTWTDIRRWTTSTISHNLVAVDGQDQEARASDGDLLQYFPDVAGVTMVEADGIRGYSNVKGLDIYRRMLALIPVSEADAYVLDLFRVRGGKVHDWLAHGDADQDMTAECSLELGDEGDTMLATPFADLDPQPSALYGMIKRPRSARAAGPFTATFRYVDEPSRGVRVHLMAGRPVDVFLGQSPSVRRAGTGNRGDSRVVYDYWMPHLVARRQAEAAPLDSTFAALEEPFSGEPFISNTERLQVAPPSSGVVALRVSHGDCVDTILAAVGPDAPTMPISADGVELTGRLGVVRRTEGRVANMWLFSGSRLACGASVLQTDAPTLAGSISSAPRQLEGAAADAFITAADLPAGDVLRGAWMIVTHPSGFTHGYEIKSVTKDDRGSVVELSMDHGLAINGDTTREVYFPRRTFKGENTFVIPNCAAVRAGERD